MNDPLRPSVSAQARNEPSGSRLAGSWHSIVEFPATGWGAAIEPEEARRQGIYAVIPKPYRLDDLRRLIASVADAQAKKRSGAPLA